MDARRMGRMAFFELHSLKGKCREPQSTCRIIARMKEKDGSGCTRRTFVKSLSATALALMTNVGNAGPIEAEAAVVASGQDPTWLSLSEASRLIRDKKISSVELTQGCLNRIDRLN